MKMMAAKWGCVLHVCMEWKGSFLFLPFFFFFLKRFESFVNRKWYLYPTRHTPCHVGTCHAYFKFTMCNSVLLCATLSFFFLTYNN